MKKKSLSKKTLSCSTIKKLIAQKHKKKMINRKHKKNLLSEKKKLYKKSDVFKIAILKIKDFSFVAFYLFFKYFNYTEKCKRKYFSLILFLSSRVIISKIQMFLKHNIENFVAVL